MSTHIAASGLTKQVLSNNWEITRPVNCGKKIKINVCICHAGFVTVPAIYHGDKYHTHHSELYRTYRKCSL